MQRRDFLKLSGAGLIASSSLGGLVHAQSTVRNIDLSINSTRVLLIDGKYVNMLAFSGNSIGPRVPGPVLRVVEGDTVSVTVTNYRPEPHSFEVGGVGGSKFDVPGMVGGVPGVATKPFTAPEAGTYMYFDGSHKSEHLYRILGLHGALIVHPRDGLSVGNAARQTITPYSMDRYSGDAPARVSMVFEAFGNEPRFPGGKWVPCPLEREWSTQERIWIFNEIDPKFNALIAPTGITGSTMTGSADLLRANYVPRYFTINGRSGYDLQDAYDVTIKNYVGEPTLIRTINAGLAHHSTHIHGNHMFELAHSILSADGFLPLIGGDAGSGKVVLHDNVWERDVWPTWPMQIRDMLLPFEVPPDIPNWEKLSAGSQEPFPLRYVMHDHCEMGTTAAGGNYPQGAVLHWQINGPVGGRGVT